eukprot:4578123-Pleurochrysis_carterae.AAC.1
MDGARPIPAEKHHHSRPLAHPVSLTLSYLPSLPSFSRSPRFSLMLRLELLVSFVLALARRSRAHSHSRSPPALAL